MLESLYQGAEISCLLLGQNKRSGIMIPLKAPEVRRLNIFADFDLPALGLGSRTLTANWMMILSSLMNKALWTYVYVWHF